MFLIFIRERYLSFEGESTRKDIIFQIQSLSSSSISPQILKIRTQDFVIKINYFKY